VSGKKSFGGTFSFSNCHIIELDTGSLVLIFFDMTIARSSLLLLLLLLLLLFQMQCSTRIINYVRPNGVFSPSLTIYPDKFTIAALAGPPKFTDKKVDM
jgi:hypothetical protein